MASIKTVLVGYELYCVSNTKAMDKYSVYAKSYVKIHTTCTSPFAFNMNGRHATGVLIGYVIGQHIKQVHVNATWS